VTYTPVGGSGDTVTIQTDNNATTLTISRLEERLVYVVTIAANNSQGLGPAAVVRLPTMGRSCDVTTYHIRRIFILYGWIVKHNDYVKFNFSKILSN